MARFDDGPDQLLHLERVEVAGQGTPEDLLRVLLRVTGPARRVDQRHVVALDDLTVREEQRRLHPELTAAGILWDRRLLASGLGRRGLDGHRRPSLVERTQRGIKITSDIIASRG